MHFLFWKSCISKNIDCHGSFFFLNKLFENNTYNECFFLVVWFSMAKHCNKIKFTKSLVTFCLTMPVRGQHQSSLPEKIMLVSCLRIVLKRWEGCVTICCTQMELAKLGIRIPFDRPSALSTWLVMLPQVEVEFTLFCVGSHGMMFQSLPKKEILVWYEACSQEVWGQCKDLLQLTKLQKIVYLKGINIFEDIAVKWYYCLNSITVPEVLSFNTLSATAFPSYLIPRIEVEQDWPCSLMT